MNCNIEYDDKSKYYKYKGNKSFENINIKSIFESDKLDKIPNQVLKFMIYQLKKDYDSLKNKYDDLEIRNDISKYHMDNDDYDNCNLCGIKFNRINNKYFKCDLCCETHCGFCTDKIIGNNDDTYGKKCIENINYCSMCNKINIINKKYFYCKKCRYFHCTDCSNYIYVFDWYGIHHYIGTKCLNKISCCLCNKTIDVYIKYCTKSK